MELTPDEGFGGAGADGAGLLGVVEVRDAALEVLCALVVVDGAGVAAVDLGGGGVGEVGCIVVVSCRYFRDVVYW